MRDHEEYAAWSGAYVLGALSAAERQDYERHLRGCTQCRHDVAELAPLSGLLAQVDPADALALLEEAGAGHDLSPELAVPPADLERRLLAAARSDASTRKRWWRRPSVRPQVGLAAAVAAAAAAVAVPVAIHESRLDQRPVAVDVRLARRVSLPLSAEVALRPMAWGTRVDMTCTYQDEHVGEVRAYALYVVDSVDRPELVSRWHVRPGQTARTTGSTDLAIRDIRQVQLRDGTGATVLLAGEVSG